MASAPCPSHLSRVRTLYKLILRLHRGLPQELNAIGDQYVKDEFRRHKAAEAQFVPVFMNEWTDYAISLAKQLGKRKQSPILGRDLTGEQMNWLSGEQVGQLYELFAETQKPVNPENPTGFNPHVKQRPDADS